MERRLFELEGRVASLEYILKQYSGGTRGVHMQNVDTTSQNVATGVVAPPTSRYKLPNPCVKCTGSPTRKVQDGEDTRYVCASCDERGK